MQLLQKLEKRGGKCEEKEAKTELPEGDRENFRLAGSSHRILHVHHGYNCQVIEFLSSKYYVLIEKCLDYEPLRFISIKSWRISKEKSK